ncbi:hypothetical protein A3K55_02545 [Candidatus Shapirobacteria bacterium RBG_13_44_7]|uniref:Uncharacterized protein n=1 Tax=Candidatus Shapirobacteria bacterium RBG_13_44_7 TaxID=1802149 RepID=A0A1F7SJX7_9BACT|nr:MAG: hypothetical protein A3K55_02545 [Candidatus Shapirobacteria bacterium RBG_13_44_7]
MKIIKGVEVGVLSELENQGRGRIPLLSGGKELRRGQRIVLAPSVLFGDVIRSTRVRIEKVERRTRTRPRTLVVGR